MSTGQTLNNKKRRRGRLEKINGQEYCYSSDLLHFWTQHTSVFYVSQTETIFHTAHLPFFSPSSAYTSLLWRSNVLCTTCKPHPTEEALWSCPPCCLPSHRGSGYHYYLPCQTINIAPKHNTRDFSRHSKSVSFLCGFKLSPKIELSICVLVAKACAAVRAKSSVLFYLGGL